MKQRTCTVTLALLLLNGFAATVLHAQAAPTAYRKLELSAFGGLSGVYTGLLDGKNLSITAGGDLGFRSFFGLRPAIEVRGTIPVDGGQLIKEKEVLGGVRISKSFRRFTPYGDILAGRGSITYPGGFVNPDGTVEYLENPSNVFSGGGGVDIDLTDHFAVKADAQYQRFNTPVTTTGHIYTKPLTLAVVYRFNFGHYPTR